MAAAFRPESSTVASDLSPCPVTPIEAFLRRRDWQLAVLTVALVVVPGALDQFGESGPDGKGAGRVAARDGPRGRPHRTGTGRHVRPPRAC